MRNGKITQADLKFGGSMTVEQEMQTNQNLLDRTLHEIHDWQDVLGPETVETGAAAWMNVMLGVPAEANPTE